VLLASSLLGLAWVGGSTYLHRAAPVYRPSEPLEAHHFNSLLSRDGLPDLEKVATDGPLALYRLVGLRAAPGPPLAAVTTHA
jgi:hypothetical protein